MAVLSFPGCPGTSEIADGVTYPSISVPHRVVFEWSPEDAVSMGGSGADVLTAIFVERNSYAGAVTEVEVCFHAGRNDDDFVIVAPGVDRTRGLLEYCGTSNDRGELEVGFWVREVAAGEDSDLVDHQVHVETAFEVEGFPLTTSERVP